MAKVFETFKHDIKRKFELAGIKNPFLKENEE